MKTVIFITGASGTIGRGVISELEKNKSIEIYALQHTSRLKRSSITSGVMHIVSGDITQPRLGVSSREYQKLTSRVTHVIHLAALTKFNAPLTLTPTVGK